MSRFPFAIAVLIAALLSSVASRPHPARAGLYSLLTTIAVPGGLTSMDIFWADPGIGRAFLADRGSGAAGASIDVIDTRANTFLGRIPSADGTGTNGVTTDPNTHTVFYGTTGSLLVAADPMALTNLASVSTGGAGRADELAVDPVNKLIVIANEADAFDTLIGYTDPPNVTLTVLAKLDFPGADGAMEQTVWLPGMGFFQSFPASTFANEGAVLQLSASNAPGALAIAQTFPLDCSPAGLAAGPGASLYVGCEPQPEVVNPTDGTLLGKLNGAGASDDEVWYNPGMNQYLSTNEIAGTSTTSTFLNIYDATTNTLLERDPVGGNHKNLTADRQNNEIFVALRPPNSFCAAGCIAVFGLGAPALPSR